MGKYATLPNNAVWHCRIEQKDGSYRVDRELIDLFLDIFCRNLEWTVEDTDLLIKVKEYYKFYNGQLMYSKINDIKKMINEGINSKGIALMLD